MYRIRLATGHETVFETVEDIARGVSTGTITPECSILHAKAGKWLPITMHPLYKTALEVAEQMASRPARPKRVSRPLPRVDTPSPERTAPLRPRAEPSAPKSGGALSPAEAEPSPAAHELTAAAPRGMRSADSRDDRGEDDVSPDPTRDVEVPSDNQESPALNDGLLDLGPIASSSRRDSGELIIERGPPPPDFEPPTPILTPPVEARTAPERTRRAEPPAPASPEPKQPPARREEQPPTKEALVEWPEAVERDRAEAPYVVPEGAPLKRAEGPLPIGAALGDFSDESKVDATMPPSRRGSDRRPSGAQPVVREDHDRRAAAPRPAPRDPFGHSKQRSTTHRAPLLAAAGLVGVVVTVWLLKAFVLGSGADPVEAATRRDTTATLAASTRADRPVTPPRAIAGNAQATADSNVGSAGPGNPGVESIRQPAIEPDGGVSEYVTAYNAARAELEIALAAIDGTSLLAPERWRRGEGALASQQQVRTIQAALAVFRAKEAEIESTRPASEPSLRETTPQLRRAELMLGALDSLFGWVASQAGQYVMVEDAIVFRGDSTQEARYMDLRRRVLDEVYRPGPVPPSIGQLVRAMDSTLFPTPSSIPDAPALPSFSLPADSTELR